MKDFDKVFSCIDPKSFVDGWLLVFERHSSIHKVGALKMIWCIFCVYLFILLLVSHDLMFLTVFWKRVSVPLFIDEVPGFVLLLCAL